MALTLTCGSARWFSTSLGHVWGGADDPKGRVLNPGFKALLVRGAEWAATGNVTLPAQWKDVVQHDMLSDAEKVGGWELLLDGNSPIGLKGYRLNKFPGGKGWEADKGELHHAAGAGGG